MGAVTRKRVAATPNEEAPTSAAKRIRTGGRGGGAASPRMASPQAPPAAASPRPKPSAPAVPKKGSRGAAFLAAAGISVQPASSPQGGLSPPLLSTAHKSAARARAAASPLLPPSAAQQRAARTRNPLLSQVLPHKLTVLVDMFAGVQNVVGVMRRRQQRTTFQNMRQAVEEASGRRFLLSHVAQLQELLPEVVGSEWVRLPVAAHTSRTEPHLLLSLDMAAAAEAAARSGAAPGAAPGAGELQAARSLLHCRLADHLLRSYGQHLGTRAEELREAGDEAAAAALATAAAAAAHPPVSHFVAPYPEGVADVPQRRLPPRPEGPASGSRGGSLANLGGPAVAAQQLAVPLTPVTAGLQPPPSTGRAGRPPMHPGTVEQQRIRQRRLSFGQAAAAEAMPCRAALAAAAGQGHVAGRGAGTGTPLEKLHRQLEGQQAAPLDSQQHSQQAQEQLVLSELHPRQAGLAACLTPEDLRFEAADGDALAARDARLLASMPDELRRLSTDGVISLDTLRMLDVAEQQHRRLSGREAQERRESNAALGQLPRTFSRVQRIFGAQGPNALKLRDVVLRIKRGGGEGTSEAQIEAQLHSLAEHAPEFAAVRPYGRCGTPALWIDRSCNGNAVVQRLKAVAEARLQPAA